MSETKTQTRARDWLDEVLSGTPNWDLFNTPPPCGLSVIYNKETREARPLLCKSRRCPTCRGYMAKRYAEQVEAEGGAWQFRLVKVSKKDWAALHKRLKRGEASYKRFPTAKGSCLLITSDPAGCESEPLPVDKAELIKLFDTLLQRVPEGERVSGTQGFGGSWHGAHAKNKEHKWVRFDVTLDKVRVAMHGFADDLRYRAVDLQFRAGAVDQGAERENEHGGIYLTNIEDPEGLLTRISRWPKEEDGDMSK